MTSLAIQWVAYRVAFWSRLAPPLVFEAFHTTTSSLTKHWASPREPADQTLAELWRVQNNRCVEVWAQFSDQKAWDAFWR